MSDNLLKYLPIEYEDEFGGVYINIPVKEFGDFGFDYGDSIDVIFSNGYTLNDVPYYNGYYSAVDEPMVCGFPGRRHIKALYNYGKNIWKDGKFEDGMTATIVLHEKEKYLAIQNIRHIIYGDEREMYTSDEVFCNFRMVHCGRIRDGRLYRSASPCDSQHNRAAITDRLMERVGVQYVIDVADSTEKILWYFSEPEYDSPYFRSLFEKGKVLAEPMTINYRSERFQKSMIRCFEGIADNEGPALIHCMEGKDRTGYIFAVLEALAGASYDEIVTDYMLSYENYYGIDPVNEKIRYDAIVKNVLNPMFESFTDKTGIDFREADLSAYAGKYLLKAGMTKDSLNRFLKRLTR